MKTVQHSVATIALHSDAHYRSDQAVAPAINQSVTYLAENPQQFAEKATEPRNTEFYGRHGNPNAAQLAHVIAKLEGAEAGLVLASGMGALTTTILTFVEQGDHIIAQKSHYSATANFLKNFLIKFGVDISFVDQTSPSDFAAAIRPKTVLILLETPSNPLGTLTDLAAVSNIAKAEGILTVCDNTLMSPINQRPLEHDIDIVVHSATKYIGGHHDLLTGVVVGRKEYIDGIWQTLMDLGPVGAPFDAWLALRGLRTLKARMDVHNSNAAAIATFLEKHAKIESVFYPGLESHPQKELALRQMSGFGGVLSFTLKGGYAAGVKLNSSLKLCQNAASLGGIDTLIVQPAVMFRARLSDEQIQEQGIKPGLMRLSVGIEDETDLLNDLEQALNKL